jgi:hypothetical protein
MTIFVSNHPTRNLPCSCRLFRRSARSARRARKRARGPKRNQGASNQRGCNAKSLATKSINPLISPLSKYRRVIRDQPISPTAPTKDSSRIIERPNEALATETPYSPHPPLQRTDRKIAGFSLPAPRYWHSLSSLI